LNIEVPLLGNYGYDYLLSDKDNESMFQKC
jgi:hypothetical protein